MIERRVLRDDELEGLLVERGYVVVPLLSGNEVAELRDWYLGASSGLMAPTTQLTPSSR
jgi:hypothetical protein